MAYSKYDGAPHWNHPARLLGEDEHGVWAGCPAGTSGSRGGEPPVVWSEPFVMLFPRDAWWTAIFNAAPHKFEVYCDVSTVPRWSGGEVTMVDLDLDVIRVREDGRVFLDDEDEFEEHRVTYAYPPEVVGNARAAAAALLTAVTTRTAPFARAPHWLSRVT
ncbi:hypothetical protein GCM10017673_05180 [Streptosporangium violaceochromogenes]|nr:hypothetical protein GCM10017673_05180 [Streptosporangium violaceochromogenes]